MKFIKAKTLLLCSGLAFLMTLPVVSIPRIGNAETSGNAIKVGSEVEFPPFAEVDKEGQASGFSVDLIKAVANAMGLSITFTTGPWDKMWNGLVSGQYDVVPIVAISSDRKRLVDFSIPHTETYDAFFVRDGSPPIPNIHDAENKTIIVMRSDVAHHELLAREFKGELTLVDTLPEGLRLLASGKKDALLCSKLIGVLAMEEHGIKGITAGPIINDYKRVFAFGLKKGADELREKLNQGLLIVKSNGEYDRIYNKWLTTGKSLKTKPFKSTPLKTIIVDNYSPYTFLNPKGVPDGFSVELAKAVVKVMGMELDIRADTWQNAMKALKSGQIDFLPMMAYSSEREKLFDFSAPHTIAYDAFFTRADSKEIDSMADLKGKRVIVLKNDRANDYFTSSGLSKDNQLIQAETLPDTLRMLSAGKGDVALIPKLVGLIQIRQLKLLNLKLSPLVLDDYDRSFCFAVQKGDMVLLDKLSQGLSILKATGQYHTIYNTWFGGLEPRSITIQSALKYGALGIFVFLVIGMMLSIWSVVLRRQVKNRTSALNEEIRERRKIEEALRASESRYAITLDAVNDGIWDWDVPSGNAFFSARYYGLLGYDKDEFTASYTTWRKIVHPEDIERVEQDLRKSVESGGGFTIDLRMKMKSGGFRWVSTRGKAVEWDSVGKALRMVGTLSDITERKKSEEEKIKLQDLLSQAQKMEAIGRLAGGVAHDFNNMLSIIMGYAEMTLDTLESTDPLRGNIEEILLAGNRSTLVVRQLMAFARKQTISPKALDLNEAVSDILKMLRRLIGEGIDLQWKPGNDLWPVKMDPSQIDQLLANLAVNARDAIGDVGKVIIETTNACLDETYCTTHPDSKPGDFVILSLSDNGCGMDKETLLNIFEPFYTTKDLGKGTGLGLATVYGIVRQNDGFITVYSEPGQGSTFRIHIPRHHSDEAAEVKTVEPTKPQTGTETVLLVEDEQSIMKLGKKMIERLGYTVLTANTPTEALKIAEAYEGDIHLLITDVIMPEMNGSVLVKRLVELIPGLKHLFMSGYTANAISQHGVLEEGVHFIQKPFSLKDFSAKIRGALE